MNKVTSEDTSSMKIKWQCDSGGGEAVRDREVRGVDVNEETRQATSRSGGGVFLAERIVGNQSPKEKVWLYSRSRRKPEVPSAQ